MCNLTNSEKLRAVKSGAKAKGLAFVANGRRLKLQRLYMLVCPDSGRLIIDNYKLETAFEDLSSGYIGALDSGSFID